MFCFAAYSSVFVTSSTRHMIIIASENMFSGLPRMLAVKILEKIPDRAAKFLVKLLAALLMHAISSLSEAVPTVLSS